MSRLAKAVAAREIGKQVTVEQIDVQAPRHGEATIRLAPMPRWHHGIDLGLRAGEATIRLAPAAFAAAMSRPPTAIAYPLPRVPGHEGAGVSRR